MDGSGDVSNVSNNFRRNDISEVSSHSMRDHEYDEETLKWAALERLSTYDRVRKGVLATTQGGVSEVDVKRLGVKERKTLIERLLNNVEDNEKLLKLKSRIERVGIDLPSIEVRFEHLTVVAQVYPVGGAMPTSVGCLNYLNPYSSQKKNLNILRDVSGIIKPGR
ncbi:hypothetical protein Dimus_018918 [Dionaea muscipula]